MEEWQFSPEIIASTVGVATTTELEDEEVEGNGLVLGRVVHGRY